jgi:hypothetical protein
LGFAIGAGAGAATIGAGAGATAQRISDASMVAADEMTSFAC